MGKKPIPTSSEPPPPADPQAALDKEDAAWCLMRVAPLAARRFILDERIARLAEDIRRLKRERKHVQWDMDLLLAKAGKKAGGAPGT